MNNNNLIAEMCNKIIALTEENTHLSKRLIILTEDVNDLQVQAKDTDKFKNILRRTHNLEECPFCHHPVTYAKDEVTGLYTCPNCNAS